MLVLCPFDVTFGRPFKLGRIRRKRDSRGCCRHHAANRRRFTATVLPVGQNFWPDALVSRNMFNCLQPLKTVTKRWSWGTNVVRKNLPTQSLKTRVALSRVRKLSSFLKDRESVPRIRKRYCSGSPRARTSVHLTASIVKQDIIE